jgi:hypothetical protein
VDRGTRSGLNADALGWRARRRRRALLRYGRLRAGYLVRSLTGGVSTDPLKWFADFRTAWPCGDLSDDDLAYSLAYGALGDPPGDGWPDGGIARAVADIASLVTGLPDDVDVAAALLATGHADPAAETMARDVLAEFAQMGRAEWSIDPERFALLCEALNTAEADG